MILRELYIFAKRLENNELLRTNQ